MLPHKSNWTLTIIVICLIIFVSARVPRQHYEPRNASSYTYGRYYGGLNSKPIDDRLVDVDEDDMNGDMVDDSDSPYLWNREEYPNPILQPPFCRNKHPSHICDPDDILSKRDKFSLEKMIRQISTDINCYCENCTINSNGITIGVALMKAMHKPYLKHPRDYVAEYAEYLRQKWNLGICDNDIVLLISTTDRLRYPALGSTAKNVIPQKVINKLMNETKANFATSLYHGLESLIYGLHEELVRLQTTEEPSSTQEALGLDKPEEESNIALVLGLTFLILILLLIAIFCIICVVRWRRNRTQSYQPGQERDIVKSNPDAAGQPEEGRREADEVDEDEENNNQEAQETQRRAGRSWLQPMRSSIRESWTQVKAISFRKKRTSGGTETVQDYQTVETTEQRTAPKATEEEDEEDQFGVPESTSQEAVDGVDDPKNVPVYAGTTKPLQSNL